MFSKIRLIIVVLITSVILLSFQLPRKIQKKVAKEVKIAFEVENFSLKAIDVSDEVNSGLQSKITGDNLYKIIHKDKILGYAFVDKAPSKTDQFDYVVLLDTNLIIKKAKVLVYREDYGGEIGSKRWLKQFIGKTTKSSLQYRKDIVAISGATISANSMTIAVNKVLQTIEKLHQKKII